MGEITIVPAAGRSVMFVCPAWKRVELAQICLRQLALLIDELRAREVHAAAVVIADDENLDVAAGLGFETIEHENLLGAKLNAGYQHAAARGYEYVCAAATDTWMHPDRFAWLPGENALLCTRNFTVVSAAGDAQARIVIAYEGGVGNRVIPLGLLAPCGYQPLKPRQMSGCDTRTLRSIHENRDRALHLLYTDLHPYEIVGFQSEVQITRYGEFASLYLDELEPPFSGLADHYPGALVDEIHDFYAR